MRKHVGEIALNQGCEGENGKRGQRAKSGANFEEPQILYCEVWTLFDRCKENIVLKQASDMIRTVF